MVTKIKDKRKWQHNYYDYSRQMMRRWWVDDPVTVVDVRIIVNDISQIGDAILLDYLDPAVN